jgi:hypothetical protein
MLGALEDTAIAQQAPPPAQPPPRRKKGGGGGGPGGGGGGGAPPLRSPPPPPAAPPADLGAREEEGEEEAADPFTCQFCGLYDPSFTDEKLDMHYWKDCPMLTSCEQCGQIVELVALNGHLVDECDRNQAFRYDPPLGDPSYRGCPLCGIDLPDDVDARRQHMMLACQGNPRRVRG